MVKVYLSNKLHLKRILSASVLSQMQFWFHWGEGQELDHWRLMELHQASVNTGKCDLQSLYVKRNLCPNMTVLSWIKMYFGYMVVMPKRLWVYPVTIWINSIPVMTTLSGNIVPWLGSDVISNKYGNNGSQCWKVLGDLQGNLIRLYDRFEINSCPNCIYTIYSCLSDGL